MDIKQFQRLESSGRSCNAKDCSGNWVVDHCVLHLGEFDYDRNLLSPKAAYIIWRFSLLVFSSNRSVFSFVNIPICVGNRNKKPLTKRLRSLKQLVIIWTKKEVSIAQFDWSICAVILEAVSRIRFRFVDSNRKKTLALSIITIVKKLWADYDGVF